MGDADREGWRRLDGLQRQLRRHLLEGRSRQGGAAPAGGAMPASEGGAMPVGTCTLTLDEFFLFCSCSVVREGEKNFFAPAWVMREGKEFFCPAQSPRSHLFQRFIGSAAIFSLQNKRHS
jgi:hypothetical protein